MEWLFLMNSLVDFGSPQLLEPEFVSILHSAENRAKAEQLKPRTVDRKLHDLILVLLEWTARIKPITVIIDELQYLTEKDWRITRRFDSKML